jgi:hypothetical protein
MARCVRGHFFVEYVRMMRRRKDIDWERLFPAEDLAYLRHPILPNEWYPMDTFERFGIAILTQFEGVTLGAVRSWGKLSATRYSAEHPTLVAANDPVESLMRLKVLRGTFFNFMAFDIPMLIDRQARVTVTYHMDAVAEEAACHQTTGFCEEVLALSGATEIRAFFEERAWLGDAKTSFSLEWKGPPTLPPARGTFHRKSR